MLLTLSEKTHARLRGIAGALPIGLVEDVVISCGAGTVAWAGGAGFGEEPAGFRLIFVRLGIAVPVEI